MLGMTIIIKELIVLYIDVIFALIFFVWALYYIHKEYEKEYHKISDQQNL